MSGGLPGVRDCCPAMGFGTSYFYNVFFCFIQPIVQVKFQFDPKLDVCYHSSHALTSDVSIEETARAAEFFLSDGVIITGVSTGVEADPQELAGSPHIVVVNVSSYRIPRA